MRCRSSPRSTAGSRPADPPLPVWPGPPGVPQRSTSDRGAVGVPLERRNEPPVLAADAARHDVPEPRLGLPDVPVLLGATASRPTGTSCTSAASPAAAPGLVVQEATAVTPEGRITPRTPASGTTRRPRPGGGSLASSAAGRGPGHPARPRRAQGARPAALGRRRRTSDRRTGGWQTVGAVTGAFGDWPAPRRSTTDEIAGVVAEFAAAARRARGGRLRGGRDPRRARLPAAPVPLAALQPPHRRVRRRPGGPQPLPARGRRRRPGGLAGGAAAVRPGLRHRLGAGGWTSRRRSRWPAGWRRTAST